MADTSTGKEFGYQIQHKIPTEAVSGSSPAAILARGFLQSIGFNLESRDNKIALLNRAGFAGGSNS